MTDNFRTARPIRPQEPGNLPSGTARKRLGAIAALAMATLLVSALPASGASPDPAGPGQAPQQTTATPEPGARAVGLSPAQRQKLLGAAADAAAGTARSLGLDDEQKLIPKDVIQDADGTVHTRYERTFAGLPVLGGDLVVHQGAGTRTVTKASSVKLSVATTKAAVPAATAKKSALSFARTQRTDAPAVDGAPRLVVWMAAVGKPVLAWESVVSGVQEDGTPSSLHVVTDAANGRQLESFDQIRSGEGRSAYSGTVTIGSVPQGDVFQLTDAQRGGHSTYDALDGAILTDDNDVWGDGAQTSRQTAGVDAAYGAQQTWDFYQRRFGRNGIADNGVGARSFVHVGDQYANAFWDDGCFCMNYGDGIGNARPLTELDIAAHEMTHGVTSATADLEYTGESGGLNEATSDIMATAVEFFTDNPSDVPDFTIGEKADVRGTGKPLRFMDQPSKDASEKGTSQDYWSPDTKNLDPHFSSGVANHFFYLLSEGSGKKTVRGVRYNSPTFDGKRVSGIGLRNATDIWYRALTTYMTSETDYAGARTATLQAAADLFGKGSRTYEAVGDAWAGVNVGTGYVNHIAASATVRNIAAGQPTSLQVTAVSSRSDSLTYSARLPRGLTIDRATGLITGTPSKAGDVRTAVTVRDAKGNTRTLRFVWTVLASGGDFFVNPEKVGIPNWATVESPIVVTGRKGNASAQLKVHVDLFGFSTGFQIIDLVGEDGTVIPVKSWSWDTPPVTELHATYTVDASAVPANGHWKLRVVDNTPGIFTYDPGYLDSWSMTF